MTIQQQKQSGHIFRLSTVNSWASFGSCTGVILEGLLFLFVMENKGFVNSFLRKQEKSANVT